MFTLRKRLSSLRSFTTSYFRARTLRSTGSSGVFSGVQNIKTRGTSPERGAFGTKTVSSVYGVLNQKTFLLIARSRIKTRVDGRKWVDVSQWASIQTTDVRICSLS